MAKLSRNLTCALFLALPTAHGQDLAWPQFRGLDANPVGAHARLAERWSKTENVEWPQEIPGRAWSSPIATGSAEGTTALMLAVRDLEYAASVDYGDTAVLETIIAAGADLKTKNKQGKQRLIWQKHSTTPRPQAC